MFSDEELIVQIAQGDQTALESLYSRYSGLIYSLALRITGDTGAAEELLQDSFFQLWRRASQFDVARGSLVGWLLTITRHRAVSHMRQQRHRPYCGSLDDDLNLLQGARATVLEEQIARQLVGAALSGLSNTQAEAITLAYFDGLTCEEIAHQTNTTLGTAKGRLRSALRIMKTSLSNPTQMRMRANAPATLESILITNQLLSRKLRERCAQVEADALKRLAKVASAAPDMLIDCFLNMAIDLCGADSAGLSLLESDSAGDGIFRWTNIVGRLADFVGGTTPRNFSPCGVTLDRNCPQLFANQGRYFQYFNQIDIPLAEVLVIPFRVGQKTEGTIWIVSHRKETRFDLEDARIVSSLGEFAGCAFHINRSFGPRT